MFSFTVVLVPFFLSSGLDASRNSPCITPNRENGRCIPVLNCPLIVDALKSRNNERLKFASLSQCGYDTEYLVCCGLTDVPKIFSHHLLADEQTCGIEKSIDKIVGGTATDIDEYPWLALLRYEDASSGDDVGFKCGGTLINRRYVLSAAHCISVNPRDNIRLSGVRLGEWRQSTVRDCVGKKGFQKCSDPPVDVGIQRSISHPRYSTRTRDNDIGLIRLQRNVNFNDFIQPICLPPPNGELPIVGTKMVVSGWGKTEDSDNSDVKLKVSVPLVSSSVCRKVFERSGSITDNQFCAGGEEGKDACYGDSGGPIMTFVQRNGDIQWIQDGVTSWGLMCGLKFPGVYTRVSKYSTWIVDNMFNF